MTARRDQLRRLEDREFDLLVLGGGATGVGIARDAALRGLSVALVEKGDLGSGTSQTSSKLIHGGLRYLEQMQFGLVFEGTRERAVLMRNAPHLARPLPFIFPVYRTARVGMLQLSAGMWAYDVLSMFRNYRRHRMLTRGRLLRTEPELNDAGLRGGALYYDCMTDDARLTLESALDAEEHGAVVATRCEAQSFVRDEAGRTRGLLVRDGLDDHGLTGEGQPSAPFEVRARVTVVAAGPWTDALLEQRLGRRLLRPTKGAHLVLDGARLPVQHAVVLTSVRDGRVLFAIPWGARTIVGTTDTDEQDPPDAVEASRADVDYLLETANHYFPRLNAGPADVIATWAGLRPLMGADAAGHASDVSREHEIISVDPGLLAIAGGKLTTYRLMGEQVVDRALEKMGAGRVSRESSRSAEVPLPGARDPGALRDLRAYAESLAREHALDMDVALHLTRTYGLRSRHVLAAGQSAGVRPGRLVPDLPYLVDEVVFAARHDKALRLDDVLRRRTLVFLQAKDQGLGCAREAALAMGDALGWDAARVELEVMRYERLVAASRRFREDAAAPVG
ncbi:MAG: glycerol-3-phosphate dehydrogenase/oxidase [Planctomycetes bacterium]|nr:glycerol-3-phosphate dehydrogenase/oxidase [Planctomycetota bacterium]